MRDKESGMDKAMERHLDSDGANCEGVEKRLGRDYEPMSRTRKKGYGRSKSRRNPTSRRGY